MARRHCFLLWVCALAGKGQKQSRIDGLRVVLGLDHIAKRSRGPGIVPNDGDGGVHMVFSDNHPRSCALNIADRTKPTNVPNDTASHIPTMRVVIVASISEHSASVAPLDLRHLLRFAVRTRRTQTRPA